MRSQHHVRGLDIAVNNAHVMCITESTKQLLAIINRVCRRNWPLLKTRGQRRALHVLHDHHELVVNREGSTKLSDVWIIHAGKKFDLAKEAVGQLFLAGE